MAVNGFTDIVTSGLVLTLDAGNLKSYPTTGTTWTDLTNNGWNGTLVNSPGFNSSNSGSISFDGTNDYVRVSDITTITTQITVEAWVFANSIGSYNSMVAQYRTANPSVSSWILETFGSNAYFFIANGASLASGSISFETGSWKHFVGTYNGSTVKLYKDSVLSPTTGTIVAMNNSLLNINIGALYSSGGSEGSDGLWNGRISQVKIYNRALTDSEVLQNYNATKWRFI